VLVYGYFDFQSSMYMAFRHMMIPRIVAAGTSFSPLPCQAWHGYMVTIAHRVEVEVGADGHASAPPYGATAVAPPAGATPHDLFEIYTLTSQRPPTTLAKYRDGHPPHGHESHMHPLYIHNR
jgi:hypothetical protein